MPTFCLLSGCTPEHVYSLIELCGNYESPESDDGSVSEPLVLEAIDTLIDDDFKNGIEDVTVIAAMENGQTISDWYDGMEALRLPESSLRIIPHCRMDAFGRSVSAPPPNEEQKYFVSPSTNIMINSASLPILTQSSGGRMTPQRYWRLLMHKGLSRPEFKSYELPGIDYGNMAQFMTNPSEPTPGLFIEDVVPFEELGDVKLIQQAILNRGNFWLWMRPDRFPVSGQYFEPCFVQNPSMVQQVSRIEKLPVEILVQILSHVPLPSLLRFLFTSHHLRSKLLLFKSDRDQLARVWMESSAPWYLPVLNGDGEVVLINEGDHDVADRRGANGNYVVGWAYLKRCLDSPSMKNRKRIWGIAQQLEKMADEMGVR